MTDDARASPIKRLLDAYVQIAKSASKRDGPSPVSIAALAEAVGLSRSRLDNLRGTYRNGRGRSMTASEAERIAAHASTVFKIPPLIIQRWLLGVASDVEAATVDMAMRAITAEAI